MNVSYSHWYGEYSPAGISESGVARVHTATRNIQIRPGQVLNRRTLGVMEISPSTANPSTSYIILDDPELAPGISRFALTTIGHGTLDRSELN